MKYVNNEVKSFIWINVNTVQSDISSVQSGYDRWSLVYDHDANPLPALEEPVVHQLVGSVHGLNVLDLGCGTGRHAVWLAGANAMVTALDFSPGMLAEARGKPGAEKIQFIEHDLHLRLPWADNAFDLVVSGLVLEHLKDLSHYFREIHRVLKPGGRAIITAMHPAMFLRGSQARFTDPSSGEVIQPGSVPHSISDCVNAGLKAGLQLQTISEHAPDVAFTERFPRAVKYLHWPMLLVMQWKRGHSA